MCGLAGRTAKSYIRHGEFLVQAYLNFIHHSNTEGEHSHEHGHLDREETAFIIRKAASMCRN